MLSWGLVGASRIARQALAPAMLAAGHAVRAVAARDQARANSFAAEFGIPTVHDSYAGLVADPGIDSVYVSLANGSHLEWTLAALAAGKHVLCEKPLGLDAGQVSQMRDAARAAGRLLMEAFCPPFHPQIRRLDELLAARALGEIVFVDSHSLHPLADRGDFRWDRSNGGGALLDLGTYCVAMTRRIVGREPRHATATARFRHGVDASLSALLDFDDASASLRCSFETTAGQRLVVEGTRGRVVLDLPFSTKGRVTRLSFAGAEETFEPADPYVGMLSHFAAAVRGDAVLQHGPDEAVAQALALDAIGSSARAGGTRVRVDDDPRLAGVTPPPSPPTGGGGKRSLLCCPVAGASASPHSPCGRGSG